VIGFGFDGAAANVQPKPSSAYPQCSRVAKLFDDADRVLPLSRIKRVGVTLRGAGAWGDRWTVRAGR